MEPTVNFAAGLEQARAELEAEGKLADRDHRIVRRLIENPLLVGPRGQRVRGLYRTHLRTRAMYAKLEKKVVVAALDWTTMVQWIKDHWFEILKFVLMIVPFII